jgi:hypothetical protein
MQIAIEIQLLSKPQTLLQVPLFSFPNNQPIVFQIQAIPN